MIGVRIGAACLLLALSAGCEKGRSPEPKTAVPAVRSDVSWQAPGKFEVHDPPMPGLLRTATPMRQAQLPAL